MGLKKFFRVDRVYNCSDPLGAVKSALFVAILIMVVSSFVTGAATLDSEAAVIVRPLADPGVGHRLREDPSIPNSGPGQPSDVPAANQMTALEPIDDPDSGQIRLVADGWGPIVGVGVGLIILVRRWVPPIYAKRLVRRRQYLKSGPGSAEIQAPTRISQSAAVTELGEIGQTGLIRTGDNWKLYDIIFNNSKSRGFPGLPDIQQSFYTVFEARLRRPVPHLVFDSKVAKKRQFNRLYVNAQWLPLEPGFTDHFEVYVPKYYQLDALGFITPEVLEAMLAMVDRDIEFLDDSLLCYAPLLAANQLDDFQAKCQRLHRHVDNNLQSYRDSWLRRQARGEGGVTDFGKQLLPNPYRHLGLAIFFGGAVAVLVVISLVGSPAVWLDPISWLMIASLVMLVGSVVLTRRQNRRREAAFRAGQTVTPEDKTAPPVARPPVVR